MRENNITLWYLFLLLVGWAPESLRVDEDETVNLFEICILERGTDPPAPVWQAFFCLTENNFQVEC